MVLVKGIEIIPKRDKVTYATNILGAWEDYRIDTHRGAVLKEAAERYKVMIKLGKEISEDEIKSLKERLTNEGTEQKKESTTDFWAVKPEPELTVVPTVDEHPSEEVVVDTINLLVEEEVTVDDTVIEGDPDELVLIKAYVKNDRQIYLTGWEDCSDWMLSAVPMPCTRAKAARLIKKASKQIAEVSAKQTIKKRFPSALNFELVPYVDTSRTELSEEEIRIKAEAMIAANRAAKNK